MYATASIRLREVPCKFSRDITVLVYVPLRVNTEAIYNSNKAIQSWHPDAFFSSLEIIIRLPWTQLAPFSSNLAVPQGPMGQYICHIQTPIVHIQFS